MIVIGAGIAGLIASNMLRGLCSAVFDRQSSVPNNHSAVLRFRTDIVSTVTGIPFKEVTLHKTVKEYSNPIADAMLYSKKTNGSWSFRSITSADGKPSKRYIAPSDFINKLSKNQNFCFDVDAEKLICEYMTNESIISTIPMPSLMAILKYPKVPEFKYVDGFNISMKVNGLDAYCSIYIPDPEIDEYRTSITGDVVTIETAMTGKRSLIDPDKIPHSELYKIVSRNLDLFGIMPETGEIDSITVKKQKYSKILPIDERERKNFILWATEKYGIYSLGRFATWRPGLMADDLVKDVNTIMEIERSGLYDHKKGA